ncbi:hypothetical protein EOM09_06445, partial [bacterium]|nr:hypothetical protein [bacterium]
GINKEDLKEYLKNKLYLSYSSLDTYNKCGFRFYLSNILKLDIYEETFGAYIGSLFHYVLQKCLDSDSPIENEIQNFIKEAGKPLNNKEQFYVNKLKKELYKLVEFLKEQKNDTELTDFMFEKKIKIEKSNKLDIYFSGIIDKIMYKELDDKIIMSLIDYKTYKLETDLRLMKYGLNMQLPIYLLLSKELSNKKILYSGFYTEQILNNSINKAETDLYKLNGYSNCDKEIIGMFDKTYEESKYISGLKVKKDGDFYASSKVLNNNEIENIISYAETKVDETIENILEATFDINPKYTTKNISCEFCNFKDICYMKEKDIENIKAETNLDFIGGDINA